MPNGGYHGYWHLGCRGQKLCAGSQVKVRVLQEDQLHRTDAFHAVLVLVPSELLPVPLSAAHGPHRSQRGPEAAQIPGDLHFAPPLCH